MLELINLPCLQSAPPGYPGQQNQGQPSDQGYGQGQNPQGQPDQQGQTQDDRGLFSSLVGGAMGGHGSHGGGGHYPQQSYGELAISSPNLT